jgi:hypothetical protein
MANAIFVFCKGLFSEAIPRLFKKLFSGAEKPPLVVTIGDNNSGITYVFNGPLTFTLPSRSSSHAASLTPSTVTQTELCDIL